VIGIAPVRLSGVPTRRAPPLPDMSMKNKTITLSSQCRHAGGNLAEPLAIPAPLRIFRFHNRVTRAG